jgi:uncharacterized membrane protein YfhO
VEVDALRPSVLVLADTYHPNWSVTVNGEPAHLAEVNDVVRGVVVPAGQSVVEFHYQSKARTVGIVISSIAGFVLLVGLVFWAIRRRRTDVAIDQVNEPLAS